MAKILEDALQNPQVFRWFGAIPASEIQAWLNRNSLRMPSDLLKFWEVTGGGDLFESETILRPTVSSTPAQFFVSDDTDSKNSAYKACGLPEHLFVFQVGSFLSAIDLHTTEFVTLNENDNFSTKSRFASLDEWYAGTLRAEFGSRYFLLAES